MSRRRVREHQQIVSCQDVALGTASADVIVPILSPSDGAKIDRIAITQQIVGTVTGAGSHTLIVEEAGTAIALTGVITIGEADAAVGTIVTADGNDAQVTAEGTLLQFQVTEVGTVATTPTVTVSIWWIT